MSDSKLPSLSDENEEGAEEATRVGAVPDPVENVIPLKGYLTVINGANPGKMYPLNVPTILVGRDADCEVRLDSESVSRKHARLVRHAGHYTLEDLGSTNGTWVDGGPAGSEPLKSGARIRFGNEVIVRFSLLDEAEAALQQRLYEGVIQDTLTGAYNRRHFDQFLANEVTQASRFKIPLALVLFEMDDMKGINDYYTQAGGDALLRAVAKLVQEMMRREDLFARIAADRFGIVARGMPREEVVALADKIRAGIERLEVPLQSGDFSMRVENAHASFAVMSFEELPDAKSAATFFAASAERLQRAKSEGGNVVISS
jgi:two-component system cell cycle response regulator